VYIITFTNTTQQKDSKMSTLYKDLSNDEMSIVWEQYSEFIQSFEIPRIVSEALDNPSGIKVIKRASSSSFEDKYIDFDFNFDDKYAPLTIAVSIDDQIKDFIHHSHPSKTEILSFLDENNWWQQQFKVVSYRHSTVAQIYSYDMDYDNLNLLNFKHKPLYILNHFDEDNKIELTSENVDHYQNMIDQTFEIIQAFLTAQLEKIHQQLESEYAKLYRSSNVQIFMDDNDF
jgi:hypothetical protein